MSTNNFQQEDSKFKAYQLVLRVDDKSCAVTVKQESEDKFTVEKSEEGETVVCSATSSEEE